MSAIRSSTSASTTLNTKSAKFAKMEEATTNGHESTRIKTPHFKFRLSNFRTLTPSLRGKIVFASFCKTFGLCVNNAKTPRKTERRGEEVGLARDSFSLGEEVPGSMFSVWKVALRPSCSTYSREFASISGSISDCAVEDEQPPSPGYGCAG